MVPANPCPHSCRARVARLRRISPRRTLAMAVLAALAGGCVNASTLQTARVLPPGDMMVLAGGGITKPLGGGGDALTKVMGSLPYGEVAARYGFIDGLDVGARVTLLGTGSLDAKYQFLDRGPLALATGLQFGYLTISSGSSEDTSGTGTGTSSEPAAETKKESGIIDLVIPVYASYDLGTHLAVYASPRYLLRYISTPTTGSAAHLAGTSAGIRLGDGAGLFLETTFLQDFSNSVSFLQVNAAIYWSR